MKTVEIYESVPDGSKLEVRFGPATGPVKGSVLFITSGDVADKIWPDSAIRPGPKIQQLEKGRAYMLEMHVGFTGAATATIEARIRKPDGATYSTPKNWSIQGKKDTTELRVLIIRMAS